MRYTKFGPTGMDVSVICLGCMSFGDPARGKHEWSLPEAGEPRDHQGGARRRDQLLRHRQRLLGGSSEEIVGRALAEMADRDEIVLATKVHGPMREGPNGGGLSRKAILAEIDNSLRRLGTDYVDLYQIHRWDYETPIEETLEALNDVVRAGKARYIGASSMFAWQFAKALATSERGGWARFVSMQDHYNLLYREEEREMLPLCAAEDIAVIPWSPLARGRLTRPWDARDRAHRDRRVRRHPLPRRGRADRRPHARGGGAPRSPARPGGARLAPRQPGGHRADRRRDQSRSTWPTRSPRSTSTSPTRTIAALEEPYRPHPIAGHV